MAKRTPRRIFDIFDLAQGASAPPLDILQISSVSSYKSNRRGLIRYECRVTADAVVIGAGIAGCATAYYLSKKGLNVVVVEKGEVGDEQSSRAWGFVRQQARTARELPLMMAGAIVWQEMERDLGADVEWNQGGSLTLAG